LAQGDDTRAPLRTDHHPRDAAGLTYVYPVVSRRSGGVSIGVNLNPNKACNWACVYCQVDGLVRGVAPPIDHALLARELTEFLAEARTERWLLEHAPEGARRLTDVAFSGDGEPTTVADFDAVVACVVDVLVRAGLAGQLPLVLITNGSQVSKPHVQRGLARLARAGGTVWFKLDRGTRAARELVNGTATSDERVLTDLAHAAALAPTRVQSCWFTVDGAAPSDLELDAWLALLAEARRRGVVLVDVMLYSLARPSRQPAAPRLGRVDETWLRGLAGQVEALGIGCRVHP
jgi:wyosine [tRNA(Phe)-imidazoG37] synthetase (radical SAM superfamily)